VDAVAINDADQLQMLLSAIVNDWQVDEVHPAVVEMARQTVCDPGANATLNVEL